MSAQSAEFGHVEEAIARVESHPVRNALTKEVTGYMLSASEWREIRSLLRTPPEGSDR